jgi:hypothetical protein
MTWKKKILALWTQERLVWTFDSGEACLDVLQHLDIGLEKVTHFMMDLAEEQQTMVKEENLARRALEHKVNMLTREAGVRPAALSSDYNAPTVWGSIGALRSKLD